MENQPMTLSIIIPLLNEEENIAPLLISIYEELADYDYELILVDDCSTDNTLNEIYKLKNQRTSVISLKRTFGQSAALKAGIDFSKGEYLVFLDGDLQNDPKDISLLLNTIIKEQVGVVQGYRQERFDKWTKTFPSKIANKLIGILFRLPLHDIGCALKIVHRPSLAGIHFFNGFHRYLALLLFKKGDAVSEAIVRHHPRIHGKSKYGLGRIKRVLKDLMLIQTNSIQKSAVVHYEIIDKE